MSKNSVVIVDYGSGNLRSAAKAFEKVVAEQSMDFDVLVSDKTQDIDNASHVVLPGQGAFGDCMRGLQNSGLIEALENNILDKRKPFLGICVGMQLLADEGLEHGHHKGLGWIGGKVVPIEPQDKNLKIPHMGWNEHITSAVGEAHAVIKTIKQGTHFYFVHSYVFEAKDNICLGRFSYGREYCAIVGRNNILGVQFHPEKSHDHGLALLGNFLSWKP
ncbi:MAG: imidazole glycerol phosphate synthase subunit HisH [Alphaproteobacteria bacterium]